MKHYIEKNRERFLDELYSLLRIPSVSSLDEHKPDMKKCADRLVELLLEAGADTASVYPTEGHPVVFGEKIVDYVIDGRKERPGDAVLVTGTIGDHGTAILSERESLGFETEVVSDAAPLNKMIETLLAAVPVVHVLRDPTRGGVAATLNEIAHQSGVGVELDERSLPVRPAVAAACEFLGLDPLYVANEGKLLVILPEEYAEKALEALRSDPHGGNAAVIGRITEEHAGVVEMTTLPGGKRLVDWLHGEQLPRIC